MATLSQKDIQDWLRYWQATKSVAVHNINAFDQVAEARKYCSCMRKGVFCEVTDLQIWRALCNMRDGRYLEAPQ